ncbi:MAG: branched-chain amino acid transport system permease protein livM [Actinomycetota bacterium]|jgi:branched-chain amino acid transport system permease protein|nr:branched-chain amino acid transport system permease protein livM [Actinomycetota bacterium]
MSPADLKARLSLDNPAVVAVGRAWRNPRFGPALQGLTGVLALMAVLHVAFRNNPPVYGIYIFGAIVGMLYAMVAFGLILVYKATRIINFAQAQVGAVPAVLAVLLIKIHHWPYPLAFVVCLVVAALCGALIEIGVVRRLSRAPRLILSVGTIGVAIIFAAIQLLLPRALGSKKAVDPTPPKNPLSGIGANLYGTHFDANAIVIILAAAVVMAALGLFFKYTDVGLAVRASSENQDRANLLGIPTKRVSTIVWMLAAVLSSLGVFLRIPVIGIPVGVDIGPAVLVYSLAVAVIAKMERFGVALVAGLCIGILEQTIYAFSRDPSVASAVMLPILLGAMLTQRGKLSRGQDSGVSTWQQSSEFRPIPPELRHVPEVAWGKVIGGALVLGGALALPFVVSLGQQILASVVLIYAMAAVSLVILTGWAGQISLGQWGFAGIGALVTGGLAAHHHADFFVTVVAAGLVGAVAAVVIGLPALRIQGLYLAVSTLAFAIAVQVYLLSPTYLGSVLPSFKQQIRRPVLYGRYSVAEPKPFYYLTLVFLLLCLASARSLRKSRAGRVIIAARDNEKGAQSYGVSIARARLAAFAISGFWAAVAGSLFAFHQEAIDAASFSPERSLELLVIVVIGGLTSLPGALLAASWFGFLRYGPIRGATSQALTSGVGVLLLLMFLPGGLAQVYYSARDGLLRWVAERRHILVPSLVADSLTEEGKEIVTPLPEEESAILHAEEIVAETDHFEVIDA